MVWINGAFGVGKTSAARELVRLLPHARTVDPERLGWALQHTVGRTQRGDFQHLRSWRHGSVLLARWAARGGATVVVPMSVLRPDYLDDVLTGLRASGHSVHHVLMDASDAVLHERIGTDEQDPAAAEWRRSHVDVYREVEPELAARGTTVDTNLRTPSQVAALIAADLTDARDRQT